MSNIILHEAVYRQSPELWPNICYRKRCVEGGLNCVQHYVGWSCV